MKKTLAAVAVLGAFAGSALAADVTLYGIVDTGFQYNHIDYDGAKADVDKFSMESGQQSGSRFGLKGVEDLGNGLKVGFILENQISSDTGALSDEDHFFARESAIFLEGGFGKVAFGRVGSINGGTSSWGKIGMLSAFGTSWGNSAKIGTYLYSGDRLDNTISYETPNFAGLKVYAQYSMGGNKYTYDDADGIEQEVTGVENESSSDRYYAIGATYNNGPVGLFLSVDSTNYKSWYYEDKAKSATAHDTDDSLTVTLGGSYDFEVVKAYLALQYFDEMSGKFLNSSAKVGKVKGWAATVSADAPIAGGKAMFGVGYYDASAADSVTDNAGEDFDLTRWGVSVGYDYPLSKRTNIYGVAAYLQDKLEMDKSTTKDHDPSTYQVMVGLRHKF